MHSSIARIACLLAVLCMPALAVAGPVNVNTADASQIAKELKGVGLAKAQAIVQYRDKNGPFKSADDLRKVKGFGPKMLERNRANIRLNNARPAKGVEAPSATAEP
ncbi:MAG: helix-hairpin-helix domain-containing protein [Steroidobacteraceae bacterium]